MTQKVSCTLKSIHKHKHTKQQEKHFHFIVLSSYTVVTITNIIIALLSSSLSIDTSVVHNTSTTINNNSKNNNNNNNIDQYFPMMIRVASAFQHTTTSKTKPAAAAADVVVPFSKMYFSSSSLYVQKIQRSLFQSRVVGRRTIIQAKLVPTGTQSPFVSTTTTTNYRNNFGLYKQQQQQQQQFNTRRVYSSLESTSTTLSSHIDGTVTISTDSTDNNEHNNNKKIATTTTATKVAGTTTNNNNNNNNSKLLNLSTVEYNELETVLVQGWGYPKYRVDQVWDWIRVKGITNPDQMLNIPNALKKQLNDYTVQSSLELIVEMTSKDGTIKRAYKCYDGQIIESVLMPYSESGRYTACISSQAGCAQGCIFCATGQMGFSRQLSSDEIFEQVSRFAAELNQKQHQKKNEDVSTTSTSSTSTRTAVSTKTKFSSKQQQQQQQQQSVQAMRLSNVVFMGMGEPLANYKNVVTAVNRITSELGIGARKITISTVGIVPNIRKLTHDPNMPQVRLAVSLHCATDTERSALLPANTRYGGLSSLMDSLNEYISTTGRRISLEWALIDGTNDTPEVARQLGNLLINGGNHPNDNYPKLRRDMIHINVIPLNPTSLYNNGKPSQRSNVNIFIDTIQNEFGIACTPRVRRGIDINAGCGQLKAQIVPKTNSASSTTTATTASTEQGQGQDNDDNEIDLYNMDNLRGSNIEDKAVPKGALDMKTLSDFVPKPVPTVGVYDDDDDDADADDDADDDDNYDDDNYDDEEDNNNNNNRTNGTTQYQQMLVHSDSVDLDNDEYEFEDPEFVNEYEISEAQRLLSLVKGTMVQSTLLSSSSSSEEQDDVTTKKKRKRSKNSK